MKTIPQAQKDLIKIRYELDALEKQMKRMHSVILVEQKLREVRNENYYLRSELRELLEKYSCLTSTGAQSLCAKIKRILYKANESKEVDNREKKAI